MRQGGVLHTVWRTLPEHAELGGATPLTMSRPSPCSAHPAILCSVTRVPGGRPQEVGILVQEKRHGIKQPSPSLSVFVWKQPSNRPNAQGP